MSEFNRRRAEQVVKLIEQDGVDVLLLFPGANIRYYTGFSIELSERLAAAVLPVEGSPYFVLNKLEEELRGLRPWFSEVVTWEEYDDPVKLLAETLIKNGYGSSVLGIPAEAPWGWINQLQRILPDARMVDVNERLNYVRMVKAPIELDNIKTACRLSDETMNEAFNQLHTSMSELELQELLITGMKRRGGEDTFASVLFGERAALPHGMASDRRLSPGEFVLVDMGTTYNGYWSDCTRTVIYGEPSAKQRRIYDIVLRANQAAYAAIQPGVACESIDEAARKLIEEAGYGKFFIHRLGHGVGLEIHERPYMVKNNKRLLEPNMVFSDEPGIYISGELGVRIEDTVACTVDGADYLTHFDRELKKYPVNT
jgi:Xaa-Pro dipeptidase